VATMRVAYLEGRSGMLYTGSRLLTRAALFPNRPKPTEPRA